MTHPLDGPIAKMIRGILVPVLLTVLTALLSVLLQRVSEVQQLQQAHARSVSDIRENFATLGTKVDWALVQRIESLEQRVQRLEGRK